MADKIHTVQKLLRVTPQEASLIRERAKERNLSEAKYMRLLISQKPNDYPEIRALLKELINEINHIGVNVNQIVYRHNTELYSERDKILLVAHMKKINTTLKEVSVALGN